jgi:hypothetical protein
VNAPDGKTGLLTFEISKPKDAFGETPIINIKNLTARACSVSYQLLSYDNKKRRVAEGSDSFEIGPGETVLRQPLLIPDVADFLTYSSFRIIGEMNY